MFKKKQNHLTKEQLIAQASQKAEAERLASKLNNVLPCFREDTDSAADALIFANTLSQQLQLIAQDRIRNFKLSDFSKELEPKELNAHSARYRRIVDTMKDETIRDAVLVLGMVMKKIEDGLNKIATDKKTNEIL